jgi:serine protease AprX
MRHGCGSTKTIGEGTARTRRVRASRWLTPVIVLVTAVLMALPASAVGSTGNGNGNAITAFVAPPLLEAAQANPSATFDVIVQGSPGRKSVDVGADVAAESLGNPAPKAFRSISGVEAQLSGKQLLKLARKPGILAITPNAPVNVSGSISANTLSNTQKWPLVAGAPKYWPDASKGTLATPTIAVVDSGIDTTRPDVAGRVLEQVTLTSLPNNSPGDGRGHGTFVASIAAGSAPGYAGAAPSAPLVSIDVADDSGMAMTSDVISAADWILQNKDRLNIRVANFSLTATNPGSFMFDPLNKAVERLWFNGVVVVTAAGNYGAAGRGVPFAPADDPFVITVGASDIDGSVGTNDDFAAPWSAYGYTLDGFAKPDLGAPGRYIVGAVPLNATLATERSSAVVSPGYMQLSGTSFSAPVVSGAAAILLALHPSWTPDQVKGALMLSARPTSGPLGSLGVGEVNVAKAATVTDPPNPNLALDGFLAADPAGGSTPVFDAASWTSAALADPLWDTASWTSASWISASWTSASWTSASWTSASWTSASWTSASWTSAAWTSASWTSASWTSASQSDASWVSNAQDDINSTGGEYATPSEIYAAELDLSVDLNGDGIIGPPPPVTTTTVNLLP